MLLRLSLTTPSAITVAAPALAIRTPSRERDPDTELLYYRARFYDPQLGRFISEDPISLEGGINFYTYVQNDPLNFLDPIGLSRCNRLVGTLAGALVGAGIGGLRW